MEKTYCPFLLTMFRTRFRTLTLTVLLGFGLSGCADDGSDLDEPIAADQQGDPTDETAAEPTDDIGDPAVVEEDMTSEEDVADAGMSPAEDTELTDGSGAIDPSTTGGDAELDAAFTEGQTAPTYDSLAANDGTTEEEAVDVTDKVMGTPEAQSTTLAQVTMPSYTAETPKNEPVTMTGETGTYVVQPGDSLSAISRKIYGQLDRWHDLASTNNIPSPYMIQPGDELSFPIQGGKSENFVSKYQAVPEKTVTVKHGDTLAKIAARIYGDANYWRVFVAYNKAKLHNPHRISTGMVLTYRDPKSLSKILGAVYPSEKSGAVKTKKIALKVEPVTEEATTNDEAH